MLKLLFDREYFAMKLFYTTKARKNRKLANHVKLFEHIVDNKVRDLLIEEYFNNVCRKFCKLNLMIYSIAQKILLQLQKTASETDDEDILKFYPIIFSLEDTKKI